MESAAEGERVGRFTWRELWWEQGVPGAPTLTLCDVAVALSAIPIGPAGCEGCGVAYDFAGELLEGDPNACTFWWSGSGGISGPEGLDDRPDDYLAVQDGPDGQLLMYGWEDPADPQRWEPLDVIFSDVTQSPDPADPWDFVVSLPYYQVAVPRDQEGCRDDGVADVPIADLPASGGEPGRLECRAYGSETRDVWEVDAPIGSVVVLDRRSAEDAPVLLWVNDADGCVAEYGLTNAACPSDPTRVCPAVHLPQSGAQRVYATMLADDYCGEDLDYQLVTAGTAVRIEAGTAYQTLYDALTTGTFEMVLR